MPGVERRADIEKTALKVARRLRYKISIPKFRYRGRTPEYNYFESTNRGELTKADVNVYTFAPLRLPSAI
jgi:hypothetical protein